jgi:hypothetical protein
VRRVVVQYPHWDRTGADPEGGPVGNSGLVQSLVLHDLVDRHQLGCIHSFPEVGRGFSERESHDHPETRGLQDGQQRPRDPHLPAGRRASPFTRGRWQAPQRRSGCIRSV